MARLYGRYIFASKASALEVPTIWTWKCRGFCWLGKIGHHAWMMKKYGKPSWMRIHRSDSQIDCYVFCCVFLPLSSARKTILQRAWKAYKNAIRCLQLDCSSFHLQVPHPNSRLDSKEPSKWSSERTFLYHFKFLKRCNRQALRHF